MPRARNNNLNPGLAGFFFVGFAPGRGMSVRGWMLDNFLTDLFRNS
jgi:hypothetical protein